MAAISLQPVTSLCLPVRGCLCPPPLPPGAVACLIQSTPSFPLFSGPQTSDSSVLRNSNARFTHQRSLDVFVLQGWKRVAGSCAARPKPKLGTVSLWCNSEASDDDAAQLYEDRGLYRQEFEANGLAKVQLT